MKNKIFGGIIVVVIAGAMALNVNFKAKNSDLSDILLANVEALAISEGGDEICCIGSNFKIEPISGGWHCVNDAGNSCCPTCF